MAPAMNAVKTTTICLGQSMCCIACLTIPLVVDVAVSPEGALNAFEARDKRGEEEREPGRVPSGVSHEQTGLLEQLALNQRGQHGHGVLDKPRARKRAHKPTRTVDAALALVLAVRPLLGGLASEPCEVFTVEETTTDKLNRPDGDPQSPHVRARIAQLAVERRLGHDRLEDPLRLVVCQHAPYQLRNDLLEIGQGHEHRAPPSPPKSKNNEP